MSSMKAARGWLWPSTFRSTDPNRSLKNAGVHLASAGQLVAASVMTTGRLPRAWSWMNSVYASPDRLSIRYAGMGAPAARSRSDQMLIGCRQLPVAVAGS
jgi:hypothetical protein